MSEYECIWTLVKEAEGVARDGRAVLDALNAMKAHHVDGADLHTLMRAHPGNSDYGPQCVFNTFAVQWCENLPKKAPEWLRTLSDVAQRFDDSDCALSAGYNDYATTEVAEALLRMVRVDEHMRNVYDVFASDALAYVDRTGCLGNTKKIRRTFYDLVFARIGDVLVQPH